MNCKPNQRAVVTRTCGFPWVKAYLGMVFTVRYVAGDNRFGPVWVVDPDNLFKSGLHAGKPIRLIEDCVLTPLPDDPDPVEQDTREIEHA